MRRLLAALLCLLPLAAAGCDSATEPRIQDTRFAAHLGVDLAASTAHPSGLYYRDLVVGEGARVENGTRAHVHYRGWLANGTLFDQRQPPQQPFSFLVGNDNIILGWHLGVVGMRVGGTRQLVIPPALAYGRQGQGSIPGNAILVFEITLVGAN
jgi:FKBP-type peptidyl-prolyl cis-trans isomerase FkpA